MAAKRETEYRFLMIGKSGSGKSSTGNSIMGKEVFQASMGLSSGNKTCEIRKSAKPKNGIKFTIVDTPGFFDPLKSNKEIAEDIVKAAAGVHPGLHAVLYVLQIDRYTPEERDTFNRLEKLFDPNVVKYVIIIFTRGDELKANKMTLDALLEKADEPFKEVLQKCGNRVVVFNNKKPDDKQVKTLLGMVDKNLKANGESPYDCQVQNYVNQKLERSSTVRVNERIEADPKLKKVFSDMAEDAKKRKEEAIEQRTRLEETVAKEEKIQERIKKAIEEKEREWRANEEKERAEREKIAKAEQEQRELEEKKTKAEIAELKQKEKERKDEEEKERKRKEKEDEQKMKELQEEARKLKMEKELNQRAEEEKRKLQEEAERKQSEEKLRYEKEELDKLKEEVVRGKETGWAQDVVQGLAGLAGGAWKYAMRWFK